MSEPLVVCVVGMHRSGTSLVTHLLARLDVSLGPKEQLIPPGPDNPAGFWENRRITRLNDEILATLGGSWSRPPAFTAGWEVSAALAPARGKARVALEEDFAGLDRWGFKDPRTSLTLPFWQPLTPSMRYVLCFRNPLDVARSLRRRSPRALSFTEAQRLWLTYVTSALRHTAGRPRLVLSYDDLVTCPGDQLARIAGFVDRPRLGRGARAEALIGIVRESLRHHRARPAEVVDDPQVPFATKALYSALRLAAASELEEQGATGTELDALSACALESLQEVDRKDVLEADLDDAARVLEDTRRERDSARRVALAARSRADRRQADLTTITYRLERADADLLAERRRAEELAERVQTLTGRVATRDRTIERLQVGLDRIDAVTRSIGELRHNLSGQREQLHAVALKTDGALEASVAARQLGYEAMVGRLRERANGLVPRRATVLVVSRGDDRLLELGRRRAWHFPQAAEGQYAGYHPQTSEQAIHHLEELRRRGADFLLFPGTARWWLDHYAGLAEHLHDTARVVVSDELCILYDLGAPREPLGRLRRLLRAGRDRREDRSAFGAAVRDTTVADPLAIQPVDVVDGARDADALAARIRTTVGEAPRTGGPLVSIVMLNRNGEHHLRRCLPALERTAYEPLELVVVDNGSTDGSIAYLESLAQELRVRLVRNADNRTFSQANNQGADAAGGELILFLNNDTEPIAPSWLAWMVDTLLERDAAAVGARLVYPSRPGLDNRGDTQFPDLTLQHRGVHLTGGEGMPARPRNLGSGEDPEGPEAAASVETPAVSAACMLVRRDVFEEVGGFEERYAYGTEDIDLCLELRARDQAVLYEGRAALWHHEYGTQNAEGRQQKRLNRLRNRAVFLDRWGPRVFRQVFADRLAGTRAWSHDPVEVAITLTKDDPGAGWGDWYTAHELGDALAELGWRVSYAERYDDRWYGIDPKVDVLIVLLDAYDLRRLPRNVVSVAWVRNWTDRWLSHPWFDDYDLVLASSTRSKDLIEERSAKTAHLLPLATNPRRFRPVDPDPELEVDVLFAGNYWHQPRGVVDVLPRLDGTASVRVFGKGWEDVPGFLHLDGGPLEYERLPGAYASARIVLDDTAGPTKPYGAVNARLFDALAAGAFVLTDNEDGVRELFDDEFPVWTVETFPAVVERFLGDDESRRRLAERYRDRVLEEHTYERRAVQIRDLLLEWAGAERFGIHIGVPRRGEAESWGDYHYARALQRQLERRGRPTRVFTLPEWGEPFTAQADVVVHLFGLSELEQPRRSQINVLWVISHPELVTPELCERYDVVLVASDSFAAALSEQVTVPVVALHQATDPDRFRPDPTGPAHELLFVGNSRRVRRRAVDDAVAAGLELAIYGADWTPDLVDPRHVRGELVPNAELGRHYSSAAIVLNDHWPGMRDHGFLSNRLYDSLAAGAFVISDHVEGIDEQFDGAVVTYDGPDDLREKVERFVADPGARARHAERGRRAVLDRHTFAHRVDELLRLLHASRPTVARGHAPPDLSVGPSLRAQSAGGHVRMRAARSANGNDA